MSPASLIVSNRGQQRARVPWLRTFETAVTGKQGERERATTPVQLLIRCAVRFRCAVSSLRASKYGVWCRLRYSTLMCLTSIHTWTAETICKRCTCFLRPYTLYMHCPGWVYFPFNFDLQLRREEISGRLAHRCHSKIASPMTGYNTPR